MADNNSTRPRLLENMGLRIFSIILAIVLWLVITSYNDPVNTLTVRDVQVKLTHTDYITSQNKVYSVVDNTDVVPLVTVTAPRSIVDSLQPENILATADVTNMDSDGNVPITFYSNKYNSDIESITGSITEVTLSVEDKKTRTLTLETTYSGEPADGYVVGSVVPDQNQVRISGPESVVTSIDSAVVSVDVQDAVGTISTYQDIKLYDADGNVIDTSSLTMNITSVKVTATILPTKTVSVTAVSSGTPATGYYVTGNITVDPAEITIAGKITDLADVTEITISGASELNVDGLTESLTAEIDLRRYLPDGIVMVTSDDGDTTVTVTVEIKKTATISSGTIDE